MVRAFIRTTSSKDRESRKIILLQKISLESKWDIFKAQSKHKLPNMVNPMKNPNKASPQLMDLPVSAHNHQTVHKDKGKHKKSDLKEKNEIWAPKNSFCSFYLTNTHLSNRLNCRKFSGGSFLANWYLCSNWTTLILKSSCRSSRKCLNASQSTKSSKNLMILVTKENKSVSSLEI